MANNQNIAHSRVILVKSVFFGYGVIENFATKFASIFIIFSPLEGPSLAKVIPKGFFTLPLQHRLHISRYAHFLSKKNDESITLFTFTLETRISLALGEVAASVRKNSYLLSSIFVKFVVVVSCRFG